MLKNESGNYHGGWIGALASLLGAILYKKIPVINEVFGYEAFIPLFTAILVGLYYEFLRRKTNGEKANNNGKLTFVG